MKIAIVDDMISDCQLLSRYITDYCQQEHVHAQITTYNSGSDFIKEYAKIDYNLVFLDIYIEDINGMDIAEELRNANAQCLIVFSTTTPSFAVKSFRVRAFDYLVKPYSYRSFCETMSLCVKALKKETQYIEVKEGRVYTKVILSDIVYTDYHNHYIQIHTKDCVIRSYMSFADFSEMLKPYPQFLCCYRNCMVNMDKVASMEENSFIMNNKERIPISKKIKGEVRQSYADYVFSCVTSGPQRPV